MKRLAAGACLLAVVLSSIAAASPEITAFDRNAQDGALTVQWTDTASNRVYVVESAPDLASTNWQAVEPFSQWPVSTGAWSNAPAGDGPVFYRIYGEDLLPAPTGVTAVASNQFVVMRWAPVPGAAGYRIYWSTNASMTGLQTQAVTAAAQYVGSVPAAGSVLYYVVAALGKWGESIVSAGANVLPAVAPDGGGLLSMSEAAAFLFQGPDAPQAGVEEGTMASQRVGVVRGRVFDTAGEAVEGVRVEISGRPEFGWTHTRTDGVFDMAANGGGLLTFRFTRESYMTAERQVAVPWQEYLRMPDVVLVRRDPVVTPLDLTTDVMQVARSSVVTDADGARQATVLVPTGVTARAILPDGSDVALTNLSLRATEYSVGEGGEAAMPARLPPNSGYTYCVNLEVDEVEAMGGESVEFSAPMPYYVENFLGFAVGSPVPAGYYDEKLDRWVAAENGRVVKIVGVTGGRADLDVDGDDAADAGAALEELGVTDAEREQLAGMYAPGRDLWRVPIRHFTPWDLNWPFGPVLGSEPPQLPLEDMQPPPCPSCEAAGSIIGIQNQTLGESVPVVGTSCVLEYHSDRTPGRREAYTLDIPLTGAAPNGLLLGVELEVRIAGRLFKFSYPVSANLTQSFVWDGRDAFGRRLAGRHTAKVRVGYRYPGVYQEPGEGQRSFARFSGVPMTGIPSRDEVILWQEWEGKLGAWHAGSLGLGGWTVRDHHVYDRKGGILYRGDGRERNAAALGELTVDYIAGFMFGPGDMTPGTNEPAKQIYLESIAGMACDENGDLYIAVTGTYDANPEGLYRRRRDGAMAIPPGLDRPSLENRLLQAVAFGPQGRLHMALAKNTGGGSARIVRRETNDVLTLLAGKDYGATDEEGGAATNAALEAIAGLAVGGDGTVYFSEPAAHRVRAVNTDGTLTTLAGTGTAGFGGDDGPASAAQLNVPRGLAACADGSVLIADAQNRRVRRVSFDGRIETAAGNGDDAYGVTIAVPTGEGGPATNAPIGRPYAVAAAPDGSFFVSDELRVRYIDTAGRLSYITGSPVLAPDYARGWDADKAAAAKALSGAGAVCLAADGTLYLQASSSGGTITSGHPIIHRLARSLQGLDVGETAVPCALGLEIYVFDSRGRHRRTLDAVTGAVLRRFAYDTAGRLVEIRDQVDRATTITHLPDGTARIDGPDGHQTALAFGEQGALEAVTDPAGHTTSFAYTPDGLMTGLIDAAGERSEYVYDADGRLTSDVDPLAATQALSRVALDRGYRVTHVSAAGVTNTYRVVALDDGRQERRNTFGGIAETRSYVLPDGSSRTTYEDGTAVTNLLQPDPRFGMDAPLRAETRVSPGGRARAVGVRREVTLVDDVDPLSIAEYREYTDLGRDPFPPAHQATWTAADRTWRLVSAAGRGLAMVLDGSNLVQQIQAVGGDEPLDPATLDYDAQGRLTRTAQGDREWRYGYDGMGRVQAATNAAGDVLAFGYDAADRLTNAVSPEGRTVALAYDGRGHVTNLVMPSGMIHHFRHDGRGLVAEYRPPTGAAYQYVHTPDRRPDVLTYPSGESVDVAYDAAARPTEMIASEAQVYWEYDDETDRPARIRRTSWEPEQQLIFEYDGPMVTAVDLDGEASGRWEYTYDDSWRVTNIVYSGGGDKLSIPMVRDTDGLPSAWGPFTIEREDPRGLVTAIGQEPFLRMEYTYDSQGRLATRTHAIFGGEFYAVSFSWDAAGRIAGREETVDGTTTWYDYTYDRDGRLTQVDRDFSEFEGYGYDENGNRDLTGFWWDDPLSSFFDAQDRIERCGDFRYWVDDDGFVTGRDDDTTGAHLALSYARPTDLVEAYVDATRIAYIYDGLGRRMAREQDYSGAYDRYYYGNPDRHFELTATRDTNGVFSAYYYDDFGHLFALHRGGQWYYVATDQVGTPKIVVDASGTPVKILDYDSFGMLLGDSHPAFDLPIGFAGGIVDPVTGLVRLGFRDYEPMTGRWTAKDPILFGSGQMNLYAYAANDPIGRVDRNGLEPVSSAAADIGPGLMPAAGFDPSSFPPRQDDRMTKREARLFAQEMLRISEQELCRKTLRQALDEAYSVVFIKVMFEYAGDLTSLVERNLRARRRRAGELWEMKARQRE